LIEIARLLARNARVLILDEPTATLSDSDIERILGILKSLRAESGATRTPIPAQGGQHSGNCGQQVMAA
jgi:ABC-type branched-subunit amino acid transport system ATPase component